MTIIALIYTLCHGYLKKLYHKNVIKNMPNAISEIQNNS